MSDEMNEKEARQIDSLVALALHPEREKLQPMVEANVLRKMLEEATAELAVVESRRATAASEHGRLVLERNRQDEVNLALSDALKKAVKAPVVCWVCRQEMERREDSFVCISCDAEYRKAVKERDENAKGWKDVRECLERVAAERDAAKAELETRTREVIGEEFIAKEWELQKQLADEKAHRAALERTIDAMLEQEAEDAMI